MFYGNVIEKLPNGDLIIRPNSLEDSEEAEVMLAKGKTLFSVEPYSPNTITRDQQKKAWALMHDINNYSDNDPITLKEHELKIKFCYLTGYPDRPLFSLSNCSKDLATLYISFLVEYCFYYGIPFDGKDLHLTHDINRKMFLCAVYKRCFATSVRSQDYPLEIHHVNAVGQGNDRTKVDHRGRYFIILKAELHREIHQLGYKRFCEKWHCGAIKLTDEQLINLGLMTRKQMDERDADPNYKIKSWQIPSTHT